MPIHDDLGTRMKTFYEQIPKTKLVRRMPIAVRIDGKAFHTFTRKFKKPFDDTLMDAMQITMENLCRNIQGCVLGYTQSDEITLVLIDYNTLTTSAWFDYEVQKICSISASMATLYFNKNFKTLCALEEAEGRNSDYYEIHKKKFDQALFDSRCFNIPKEEVTNLIYWRQLDAMRNSIQMVGQAFFTQKEMHGKSCKDIQNMLLEEKDIDWNGYSVAAQRGTCCKKDENGIWQVDKQIPIFKGDGRAYIENLIYVGE